MLLYIASYFTISCCIALPFYIYGVLKWTRFQSHFLINKRFPRISELIVVVAIMTMANELIRRWLDYFNTWIVLTRDIGIVIFRSVGQANVFLISSLSVFRLMLIYQKWKRCQHKMIQFMEQKSHLKDVPAVGAPPPSSQTVKLQHVPDQSPSMHGIVDLQRIVSLSPSSPPTPVPGHMVLDAPVSGPTTSASSMEMTAEPTMDSVPSLRSTPSCDILYGLEQAAEPENGGCRGGPSLLSLLETVYQHKSSVALSVYMMTGYICILCGKIVAIPPSILAAVWLSLIGTALVLIVLIKWHDVKEGTVVICPEIFCIFKRVHIFNDHERARTDSAAPTLNFGGRSDFGGTP